MDLALLARLSRAQAGDRIDDTGAPDPPERALDVIVIEDHNVDGAGIPGAEGRIVEAPVDVLALARLGSARNEDALAKRRRQTEAARAARSKAAAERRQRPTSAEYAVALCSAAPPPKQARLQKVHPVAICDVAVSASALQVMAMIPRLRGSGLARELRWQRLGARLMASAIQRLQSDGKARLLCLFAADRAAPGAELWRMVGVNCMWDEATQKMKGALDKRQRYRTDPASTQMPATLRLTTMPVRATTMIVLTRLFLDAPSAQGRRQRWEPWVPLVSGVIVGPGSCGEVSSLDEIKNSVQRSSPVCYVFAVA